VSQLSEGRWSESSESGFCNLRWRRSYENERMGWAWEEGGRDSQAAVKSKKKVIQSQASQGSVDATETRGTQ